MTGLEQALLVVIGFATFLLLLFSLIGAVLTVMILKRIKIIVEKTRNSVESVAEVVEEVKEKVTNPSTIANFVSKFINRRK